MLRNHNPSLLVWRQLVSGLKEKGKTCAVIETCCGGLINASIMQVPGSSSVYYGGSIAYNTRKAKKLLLNDADLHSKLVSFGSEKKGDNFQSEADAYIASKQKWTEETAKAFCEQLNVDYAIAEGGASGPTFRPKEMTTGFAVIAIAGRDETGDDGKAKLLAQKTIYSKHSNRKENMKLFANSAAKLALETIGIQEEEEDSKDACGDGQDGESSIGKNKTTTTGVWLDRASHIRVDDTRLKELEEHLNPSYVVLRDGKECLFQSDSQLHLVSNNNGCVANHIPRTFLGLDIAEGRPIFVVDVKSEDMDSILEVPSNAYFDNIRTHAPLLRPKDNELVMYATAMAQWKRTHKFCSTCGHPLEPIHGGTCLKCTNQECKAHWWPRQDPSIIVLITNREGDKALLARSARHPAKMHTTLAGFVEAGETFEKAVMREAFEETGARVDPDSITYLSSQPWPFPRSCMIGFRATADDTLPLDIDPNEIVNASWFDKETVASAAQVPGAVMNHDVAKQALEKDPSLTLLIPPKGVIARALIDNWLEDSIF